MNEYEVITPFLHPKTKLRVAVGEKIKLNAAQAQTLLTQGRIKEVVAEKNTKQKAK